MAEGGGGERTESPTGKRREDFRKKGQVAQSREVNSAAMFALLLLFWIAFAPLFWERAQFLLAAIWGQCCEYAVTPASLMHLAYFIALNLAILLLPLFLTAMFIGVMASFIQIGWLFTTKPLMPDLAKFDPIKGFGRMFSKRSLVELVKSLLKVILIGWVAYQTLRNQFGEALLLVDVPVEGTIAYMAKTAVLVMGKVAAVMILLAILDFSYTRWEMEEKMKMTKQEVKEEMKESEGDPHIKSKIRSIQQQMARRRMMAAVPGADVVVTNPTHFAVAIQYDPETMDAPQVVAKGQDLVARRIRELAREHEVPLVENPPVARLLHKKVEVGQSIPEELFRAVAEILAYVYSLQGKA
ncbi:MAG: flagellar biosynthesis protein FlhB [Desulfobulbus sp.]|jgi:flagellar biosynthetic protein FlhB